MKSLHFSHKSRLIKTNLFYYTNKILIFLLNRVMIRLWSGVRIGRRIMYWKLTAWKWRISNSGNNLIRCKLRLGSWKINWGISHSWWIRARLWVYWSRSISPKRRSYNICGGRSKNGSWNTKQRYKQSKPLDYKSPNTNPSSNSSQISVKNYKTRP